MEIEPQPQIFDADESNFEELIMRGSEERVIVIDFWAPWCGPCKALTPILESQATKKKEHLEVVKVNVDENQGIASQLRVQSIPAVFAFSDGQPVDGFMGAKTEPEVEKFLDTLIKKFSKNNSNISEEFEILLSEGRFEEVKLASEELIKSSPSPENYSLLIRSAIGLGDFEIVEKLVENLSPEILKDNAVKGAISSYELMKNNDVEDSKKEILDRMQKNPADLDCKMNYSKILFKENNFSECIDVLLEMFRKDKEWKDGYAKKQLLLIFDHLGSENELSKKGRRALTSLIFV